MKLVTRWWSDRVQQEVTVARWGHWGPAVLVFPTAGGDAEEIERMHLVGAAGRLLEHGRAKIYSCDSVAGRAWLTGEGSPEHRAWLQSQFHQYVAHELVPAIRMDCRSEDVPVWTAGASIGAFNALAALCRFPGLFRGAICMSGSYDLNKFFEAPMNGDFYFSSPVHFLPDMGGHELDLLRQRFVLLASGEGRWEDIGESWRVANLLGRKGVPNRVDPWGTDWHHDWVTWRAMLPRYIDELVR